MKSQIWIAVFGCLLVAIVKKRINADATPHTFLQILTLTLFEKKMLLKDPVMNIDYTREQSGSDYQSTVFSY